MLIIIVLIVVILSQDGWGFLALGDSGGIGVFNTKEANGKVTDINWPSM